MIDDLGSSNGTFVSDDEVFEPTRVSAGDTLLIGSSVIRLRGAVPAADIAPARPPAAPRLLAQPGVEPPDPTIALIDMRIGSELAG